MTILFALTLYFIPLFSGPKGIAGIDLILQQFYETAKEPTDEEVEVMAKVIHGEAGICSDLQKSAVAWCVCNRVDCGWYSDDVISVITQPHQFHGYSKTKVPTEQEYKIAYEVLFDWLNGIDLRRTLPRQYIFFHAENHENVFTTGFKAGDVWDWSLPNSYKN